MYEQLSGRGFIIQAPKLLLQAKKGRIWIKKNLFKTNYNFCLENDFTYQLIEY